MATSASVSQAVVSGDITPAGGFIGHAGASTFPVGGPDGHGGAAVGASPYDLLSASLAACTAMTIRLQAQRKKFPLSHVEVAVSFRHGIGGARDSFDRAISFQGDLTDEQRARLIYAANMCPVGKTLGLSADIHTSAGAVASPNGTVANYDEDLELSIPNIDPD